MTNTITARDILGEINDRYTTVDLPSGIRGVLDYLATDEQRQDIYDLAVEDAPGSEIEEALFSLAAALDPEGNLRWER